MRNEEKTHRPYEAIISEHESVLREIGAKEYQRRVLDAQIGQLAQRALELNGEALASSEQEVTAHDAPTGENR